MYQAILPVPHLLAPSNHLYAMTQENKIILRATNGTDVIQTVVAADIEKEGVLTLPLVELKYIVSHAPGDKILALEVPKYEISRYSIYPHIKGRLDSICQIPVFPDYRKLTPLFQTKENVFRSGIKGVMNFAGNGNLERLWQSCVSLRRTQNADIECIACSDGVVAHKIMAITNSLSGDILLYAPALRRLHSLLGNNDRDLFCGYHEKSQSLVFSIPRVETKFVTRIQNDNFPETNESYPKEYEVDFKVNAEQLRSTLLLAHPYIHNTVKLRLDHLMLIMEAEKQPLGSISIALDCEINQCPEQFQVSVHAQRLINVVSNVETERLRVQVRIRNNQLIMVTPENDTGNKTLKYAIML
jgi:DNA polymerase III sliding clamp (beta) subunit (PCNA family)